MPTLVIVAGPNGSGKTTLVRSGELALIVPVPPTSINADDMAKALAGDRPPTDAQSLQAAQVADALVDDLIERRISFVIETVLSSDKYKPRVLAARSAGYQVILVYVTLRAPDLNVSRVANRFSQGGHTVPEERIHARRARSHDMFAWFARQADLVVVFDNSSVSPKIAAVKGPAGWLARDFGGTSAGQADWMLLAVDLLAPDLATTIRSLAADDPLPSD